jgi:hypothetical protein
MHPPDVNVSALKMFSSALLSQTGTIIRTLYKNDVIHFYDFFFGNKPSSARDYKLKLPISVTT